MTEISVTMKNMICGECGVVYAMPEALHKERLEDHRTFWCPNGHARRYVDKTKAEILEEQVVSLRAENKKLEDLRADATKSQCPCVKKTKRLKHPGATF